MNILFFCFVIAMVIIGPCETNSKFVNYIVKLISKILKNRKFLSQNGPYAQMILEYLDSDSEADRDTAFFPITITMNEEDNILTRKQFTISNIFSIVRRHIGSSEIVVCAKDQKGATRILPYEESSRVLLFFLALANEGKVTLFECFT
ncbi:hypothetical protein DdX_14098 [Ditylenchus destructor]|uniref:Uncharacterized protein n=1 Tax=Ditylenchus destructor TaxID=166010 RepID=A0AAD4QVW0_9BILA|nr:hypothetical protein DdX_14098 [Ditylenchus destructor]